MRRFLNNAILIGVATVFALVVLEIAVRATHLAADLPPQAMDMAAQLKGARQFDPVLQDRYQPNGHAEIRSPYGEFRIAYRFNELGLRDRPVPPRSGDPARRILVLGNSFVEGWGVEFDETFVQIAQKALSDARAGAGPPVRLIDAGIAGFGAAQSYLFARELIPKVKPDALVFVFVGSMVSADQTFLSLATLDAHGLAQGLDPDAFLKSGDAPAAAPPTWSDAALRRISEYSALVRLFYVRSLNRQAQLQIHAGDPATDLLAAYRAPPERMAALYEPTLRHIAGMRDLAKANGIAFSVIRLPMPFELDGAAWNPGRQAYGIPQGQVLPEPDRERLDAFCVEKQISCVSADEALKADPASLFFRYDFHLNPNGNRAVGEWLARRLSDGG
jgi:hypothetical protein